MTRNRKRDFEEMVKDIPFLEYAVEQGNEAAMFWLALNYHSGIGVVQDDAKAYNLLRKSAELGYADSQYLIAMRFLTGNDGAEEPNHAEAVRWFEAAAAQGNGEAMYELSRCFLKGKGVTVDVDASINWLKRAADSGLAEAQCKLGEAYGNGEDVKQDMDLSFRYLSLSANQGYGEAEYCLAILYRDGNGIPKDSKTSKKFFELSGTHGYTEGYVALYSMIAQEGDLNEATIYLRKAAEAGDVEAQLVMGMHYEIGQGTRKNVAKAKMWYKKAADSGNIKAVECLERLGS